jgi:hypothetical protein
MNSAAPTAAAAAAALRLAKINRMALARVRSYCRNLAAIQAQSIGRPFLKGNP